ncbi:grasp-with-spasm system ATP-grasp peptide maturase [Chitinophaga nivalis]|uniref:Grasp-with-spasm system ATP-grasp peptide maturase n=1 Tax=Chitinophaga nivalis TaxID=2991709 RepID=A0ABT3IKP1_9BACT|nr:grasp-with-spasm system ATP-grasp peptide maturase [Chitinophaga nivalis]MCW3465790.1 grasp-with-spasm system ATP-grasp peptide maturase [Chitinophaga nivalis]MCW3484519.1 grasp-with-spasm system ATP-grasp peptide maturase [Chitinophaga nivalis]
MILILSRQDDGSTAMVIQWLLAYKKEYLRLNADTHTTTFHYFDINKRELIVEQDGKMINLYDATSLWYRRRGLSMKSVPIDYSLHKKPVIPDDADFHQEHLKTEMSTLLDFIYLNVAQHSKTVLGGYRTSQVNKFEVLQIARDAGLTIPESYIMTRKKDVQNLLEKTHIGLVTKAMGNGVYHFTKKRGYYSYTEKITPAVLDAMPETFFPSLIQVQVKKKYELRIFYIKGEYYAMAIFSQHDKKTTVDFRKYNLEKPNRQVPYLLPVKVQQQLTTVMDALQLDSGSIDIIVDEHNDYVFLEVNPIGQFGMTSIPCNYYLERRIAQLL